MTYISQTWRGLFFDFGTKFNHSRGEIDHGFIKCLQEELYSMLHVFCPKIDRTMMLYSLIVLLHACTQKKNSWPTNIKYDSFTDKGKECFFILTF